MATLDVLRTLQSEVGSRRAGTPGAVRARTWLVAQCEALGLPVEMDHLGRSLKAQFKHADRLLARFVVIIGPDEFAEGEVTVRDMGTKEETRVEICELPSQLTNMFSQD